MSPTRLHAVAKPAPTREDLRPVEQGKVQLVSPMTLERYANGSFSYKEDTVAVESDIRVHVNGQQHAVLSRTPGDDLNLIVGYLFSCSMIRSAEDILNISFGYHGTTRVDVQLNAPKSIKRIFPSPRPIRVDPEQLFRFKRDFEHRQNLFKNTGSTHAAALFSLEGELLAFGEDVGRHNGFDKAIGRALLEGTLENVAIAMLSSRLALELAIKASTANIPVLCGFSAATSSAINYAEKNNLTLVGRIRDGVFNLYANGWRLHTR